MKGFKILLLILSISMEYCGAQNMKDVWQLSHDADSLYKAKNYSSAADKYVELYQVSDFNRQKMSHAYNGACCLALEGHIDSALLFLQKSIQNGYTNKAHLLEDNDLESLHKDKRWDTIIASIPKPKELNDNPSKAQFHTEDIHRFWKDYDNVLKDTSQAYNIYSNDYFKNGTAGLQDYMGMKVPNIGFFVKRVQTHPKFFPSIRANTYKADIYQPKFKKGSQRLKELYPEAKFPDIYFVMGAFTSGGTVSGNGLLIGINQSASDSSTDISEFNFTQRLLLNDADDLPYLIAHELIHFQQDSMYQDTTTLFYAIKEGMADFIGELISGKNPNTKIDNWAKGKEKRIWNAFTKDMYFNRYNNWIGNYDRSDEEHYPDLGYWVGYEICKSYFENASDPKQAIYDMLHIQDYKSFLRKSKWEEKLIKY